MHDLGRESVGQIRIFEMINYFVMSQKLAAPNKRKRKSHSRKNMTEAEKKTAEILVKYPDLLERIAKKMETIELDPWVKKYGGIINTGKNEDKSSIFD